MNNRIKLLVAILSIGLLGFFSCRKDEWNNRNKITDPALNVSLLQAIKANPHLSQFSNLLAKTGYDTVLASSKTFTVWAPTNEALKAVDESILNDTAQLRLLVANHIALGGYLTSQVQSATRIKTLSGKHISFTGNQVNTADVVKADEYVNNGVLQIINQALIPEKNAWEYLNTEYKNSLQQQFIQSLQYMFVDPDSAEQIGVDPKTGEPVYKPGTGLVKRNRFLQKVNINSEDSTLTYIILSDAAFKYQKQKLSPYFQDTTAAQTDSVTNWNIVKDLAFRGIYTPDNLPSVLYSANDSVQFHINPADIVKTQTVSNGIVYVVNWIDYDMKTKIKPVVIQAEKFYDRMDPEVGYTIRTRRNLNNDSLFKDILIENYGIASFWLRYYIPVNSVKYKVYWVSVNDFQEGTFPMRVGFKSHTDTAFVDPANIDFDYKLPYTTVELNNYNEVYIGEYTPDLYGKLDLFLIGNNVRSNGENTIVCDYIKLVPVLN